MAMDATRQGFLWKKASKFGVIRHKRYFVLNGKSLIYYKNEKDWMMKGAKSKVSTYIQDGFQVTDVRIQQTNRSSTFESEITYEFRILDRIGNSVVELSTKAKEEAEAWVRTFQQILLCSNKPIQSTIPTSLEDLMEETEKHALNDQWILGEQKLQHMEEFLRLQNHSGVIESNALHIYQEKKPLWDNIRLQGSWAKTCVNEFESLEGWIPAVQKGTSSVSYKVEEGSPINSFKLDTIIDAPFTQLAAVIAEADLGYEWIPFCSESKLLCQPTNMHGIAHLMMNFPSYLPICNRDLVIEGRGVDMLEKNSILVALRSIQNSNHCEIPEPADGVVRIDMTGGFYITLVSKTSCHVRIIFNLDMKMKALTPWMMNHLHKHTCLGIIYVLKKLLLRFDKTEYAKRVQAKQEFYGSLERRVNEFFDSKRVKELSPFPLSSSPSTMVNEHIVKAVPVYDCGPPMKASKQILNVTLVPSFLVVPIGCAFLLALCVLDLSTPKGVLVALCLAFIAGFGSAKA